MVQSTGGKREGEGEGVELTELEVVGETEGSAPIDNDDEGEGVLVDVPVDEGVDVPVGATHSVPG